MNHIIKLKPEFGQYAVYAFGYTKVANISRSKNNSWIIIVTDYGGLRRKISSLEFGSLEECVSFLSREVEKITNKIQALSLQELLICETFK